MPVAAVNGTGSAPGGGGGGEMDPELAHAEETLLMMKKAPAAAAAAGAAGRKGAFHIPPMTPTGAAFQGRRGGAGGGVVSSRTGRKPRAASAGVAGATAAVAAANAAAGLTGERRGGGGGGGGGIGGGGKRKRNATPSDLCQRCQMEGLQRGITHWHKDASRSTGGICKEHAFELHNADPRSFASSYRMRHGRACERCGILRRATHGYLGEGVSRFCGECAGTARGCIDLNNFKCKLQGCNRMARFIGEEPQIFGGGGSGGGGQGGRGGGPGRLVFRCWAHKQPEMKEAGEGWKEFYRLFCLRTGATGVVPVPPIPPPPPSPSVHAAAVAVGGGGVSLGLPLASPLLPMAGAFLGAGGNAEGTIVNMNGGGFGGGDGGGGGGEGGGRGGAFPPGGLPGPRVDEGESGGEEEEEEEEGRRGEEGGEGGRGGAWPHGAWREGTGVV
ncbi:hypothetical protein VYU27_009714 [Nannochloropsis oceanica]